MVKRGFLERARRGKQDRLLISFGDHETDAAAKNLSKLLSKHRGLFVTEAADGLTRQEAKKETKRIKEKIKSGKWEEYLKIIEAEDPFTGIELRQIAKLYRQRRGKIAYAEIYPEKELERIRELVSSQNELESLFISHLLHGNIPTALEYYNRYLNAIALENKIRNNQIIKNLSKMKGNILARYGTGHNLLFPKLRKIRPDAKKLSDGKPFFAHFEAILRAKILGKEVQPSKEKLLKACLSQYSSAARIEICNELKVSMDNPKINLFFNALLDSLSEKELESILKQTRHVRASQLLFAINNIPLSFFELTPKEKFRAMQEFSKKIYGEHSKLYRTAYH